MTDWIKHTTDACPVDPETVVEVVLRGDRSPEKRTKKAKDWWWVNNSHSSITHYRIVTPARFLNPRGVLRREITEDPADWERDPYAENAKPPELEMTHSYPDDAESYAQSRVRPEMNADAAAALKRQIADAYRAGEDAQALKAKARAQSEPDFITLRLECLKLAASPQMSGRYGLTDLEQVADRFLHYVLNGSEKETGQ